MTTKKSSAVASTQEYLGGKLWFSREGGEVTVGLTSSAIEDIGAVQSIDFPDSTGTVEEGDVIAIIEGDRDTFEVVAPMDGFICDVNTGAEDEPNIVSDDPLEEGWLVRIEPDDVEESDDEEEDEDYEDEEDEDLDDDEDFDDDLEDDEDEEEDEEEDDRG